MKKWISISLIIAISIGVVGCGKKIDSEKKSAQASESTVQTLPGTTPIETDKETTETSLSASEPKDQTKESETVYGDHLVKDQIYEEKKLIDGTEYALSYHLPILQDDTQDAQAFNAQMEQLWNDTEQPDLNDYMQCTWESYWNGSNVSIVLTLKGFMEANNQVTAYSYDFQQGRAVSNQMLLDHLGVDQKEALLAIRQSAAEIFDKNAAYTREQYENCQSVLLDLRARSLADTNLDPMNSPLYLDSTGILHAIVSIGTPAGGGYYLEDVKVPLKRDGAMEKSSVLGNVTVQLKDNQAQVTFREEIRPEEFYLSGSAIEFQKPYPVHGLYGQYKDMAIGCVGNDGTTLLCLLDTNGQVTVCDLTNAVGSCSNFYAVGPISYPGKAVGFQAEKDESAHVLWVNMEDGSQVAVDDMLRKETVYGLKAIEKSLWQQNLCQLSVHAVENNVLEFTWGNGGGILGSGYLYYAGMDGEGLQYTGDLYVEGKGTALVQITVCPDMTTNEKTLTLRYLSGDSIPSLDKNQPMKLSYTETNG